MSLTRRMRVTGLTVLVALIAMAGARTHGQAGQQPNAQPNPYRTEENFLQLRAGMVWPEGAAADTAFAGQVVGLDFDAQGNIIVMRRADPPLLKFDPSGKRLLKTWGHGLIVMTHGLLVDRDGFIWATDASGKDGKGFQVFKFSPEGQVVMTLGTKGVSGEEPNTFVAPTDLAIAQNGDVFIADGHANDGPNHRIVKYSKEGKFIKAWGRRGTGPGEFNGPHDIAIDSTGRLFVSDRGNSRILVFDQEGRLLAEWRQFSRPEVMFIDENDMLYVTDSNSNSTVNAPYKRGIRVGSTKDGVVAYFIPDTADPEKGSSGAVAIAVDPKGSIYTADIFGTAGGFAHMLKKYVRR